MFKDLLVPLTKTGGDTDAVDLAVALAERLGARLVVLEIVDLPVPTSGPWGVMQEVGLADVYSVLREEGQKNVAAMKARLAKESIRSEVRMVETLAREPEAIAALCAHYADLVVV